MKPAKDRLVQTRDIISEDAHDLHPENEDRRRDYIDRATHEEADWLVSEKRPYDPLEFLALDLDVDAHRWLDPSAYVDSADTVEDMTRKLAFVKVYAWLLSELQEE